jgi:hypothetical protein
MKHNLDKFPWKEFLKDCAACAIVLPLLIAATLAHLLYDEKNKRYYRD